MSTVKEILVKTRQFFETHDWIQHRPYRYDGIEVGGACLAAAIYYNGNGFRLHERIVECVENNALNGRSIAHWNDDPTRTKEDVLSALDRTIERL